MSRTLTTNDRPVQSIIDDRCSQDTLWYRVRLSMSRAAYEKTEDLGLTSPTEATMTTLVRRYNVERSCVRCHQRKIRCDRATPCMSCTQSNAPCVYPGPERVKRRSQKATRANAVPSLDADEPAVPSGPETDQALPSSSSHRTGQAQSLPNELAAPEHSQDIPPESDHSGGFLLKEGSSSRYINEFTFSRVLDKVCDILDGR
jgi:hypothetical protein